MEWWTELFLIVLGGGLQVWGVLVTARQFILAADAADGGLDAPPLLRLLVGVPRRTRVVDLSGASTGESSARATATVDRKKPPQGDHAAWIEFLDRRVAELDRDISDLASKVHDLHDEQVAQLRALRTHVDKVRRELRSEMQRATLEGSRISLKGVLHIVFGIVVAALAAPIARGIVVVCSLG